MFDTISKVAGTLRVPSAVSDWRMRVLGVEMVWARFMSYDTDGYGTRSVPATSIREVSTQLQN
jgi:hypothetical protein